VGELKVELKQLQRTAAKVVAIVAGVLVAYKVAKFIWKRTRN
jgi:putative flippase GtrA